jgi:outer membrane protein assembly factor BamB
MKRSAYWLLAALALSLVGCTQMEKRSDQPDKKPLVAIDAPVKLVSKWNVSAGDGTHRKDIKLLLAKAGSTLYTVDYAGEVVAIDTSKGATLWRLPLKASVSAGPTIGEGKLVVGTSDGKVIAVDLSAHKVAWQSNTTSEILAAPVISDDIVLVHTMDGGLSALSLLDGRQLWRFSHMLPPLILRMASSPVAKGDNVYAGFANGKLLALRKADGSVIWSQDISHPKGTTDLQRMVDITADPIVDRERVYAASYQGNIVQLQQDNGHVVWDRDIASQAGFAVDKNTIYVAATNGDIVALDVQKFGATDWLQTDLQGRRLTKPVVVGKYLIVADDDGVVHCIDKTSGKLVGRLAFDSRGVEATPIVSNNIVYILGSSGKLVALEVG